MKKLFSLALVLSIVLCFIGCSQKETESTYVLNEEGFETKTTICARGDVIKKMTQTTVIDLKSISEEYIAKLDEIIKESEEKTAGVEGVTYTTEKTDTTLTETYVMEIKKKATLKTLIEKGLITVDKKNADYLSLKATVSNLEANGYTLEK